MESNLVLTLSYSIPAVLRHCYPKMASAAKRRHVAKQKASTTAAAQQPKPDDPTHALKNQWKKRGIIIMNSEFKHMNPGTFEYLVETADQLEEPIFIDPNAGESQRVHLKLNRNEKIPRNAAARKLLLGSDDNDMANAIEKHINTKYGAEIVQGAKNEAPLANFVSLLKCIDNIPAHYTVQDFAREVLQILVETPKSCAEKLKKHLEKTTRSYKKLCQDLYNEKDMNCGTDFYMGAASILLDMPIMLIKPKQVKLQGGRIGYNFWQEYLLEEDKNLQVKDFKICLVFNGINHYAPFYPKELGNLINTGYKRMKQVRENYQDIKEVSQKIPKNVKINGAIQQMLIHLRAAAQIAESIRFECGVGDTSSVSQLPMPLDTGASLPSVRKRKRAEETEDTEQPPPKRLADGSDRRDTVMMPKQCHCGKVFESDNNLKRHIGILHKNDYWQCSGDMFFDDGSTEHCGHIAVDRFALWKHYRSIHQGRYLYYCDVPGCNYGTDEQTEIPKHKLDKHNKQPKKDDPAIICQNCKKVFGQKGRYKLHIQICGKPDARPFQCQHCEKSFRDRDQFRIHNRQQHPKNKGDRSGYYKCVYCGKEYTSISSRRRHYKTIHKEAL